MKKSIGTTPDPEFAIPAQNEKAKKQRSQGKSDSTESQAAQVPGGGGAPGTGEQLQAEAANEAPSTSSAL